MIKVTVMLWFDTKEGEARFSTWDTKMIPQEIQANAKQLAMSSKNGQCKIFDTENRVVGSAGF